MKKLYLFVGVSLLCATQVIAQETAKGFVFEDLNQNGKRDRGEDGIEGVAVTNGRDVVLTNKRGKYKIDVSKDAIISVIKPSNYNVLVDENQLPQFFYIHKPEGSPDLEYEGVQPTGPLPKEINFPLVKHNTGEEFKMIVFGDPQAYTEQEVEFFRDGVVKELIDVEDYEFGISLGDLVGNRPDLFNPYIVATKEVGVPWYNLLGNHDINFDVEVDSLSTESYQAHFGPTDYAFNHGKVHFIVLDDIIYPDPRDGRGYWGGLNEKQLTFIENDLKQVPKDHLIVLAFHIPISNEHGFRHEERNQLFEILKDYPHTLSLSAHTHRQNHFFMGEDQGWPQEEPHHHFNAGTTSGNWYSGRYNQDGIPDAMMSDGTPKGYAFINFDGNQYTIDYKVAGKSADHQIGVYAPKVTAAGIPGAISIYANFYIGSERDVVKLRIGDGDWQVMTRVDEVDPIFVAERVAWDMTEEVIPGRKPGNPGISSHLWRINISNVNLEKGTHEIQIKATDMFGRTFTEKKSMRVE